MPLHKDLVVLVKLLMVPVVKQESRRFFSEHEAVMGYLERECWNVLCPDRQTFSVQGLGELREHRDSD